MNKIILVCLLLLVGCTAQVDQYEIAKAVVGCGQHGGVVHITASGGYSDGYCLDGTIVKDLSNRTNGVTLQEAQVN